MPATMIISIIFVSIGAGLILIALPFLFRKKALMKKCSATTTGQVVDYKFKRGERDYITPIVEFYIDDYPYQAYRHYKGVGSVKVNSSLSKETNPEDGFFISKNDFFILRKSGQSFSYRIYAEKVWPLGSTLKVVYNPEKPKQAYVEKVVVISDIVGIVLSCVGALFVVIAGLVFILG